MSIAIYDQLGRHGVGDLHYTLKDFVFAARPTG
ncbi:MAG: hypothetical protein ACI89J_004320 [Hyphomicrobiaceae bacterium]|jgi:hypothetical protein